MTDTAETPTTERLFDSVLADDVSFLMARANSLSLAAGNGALAAFGLRARSYSVLSLTTSGARATQREIAEFLRLDPSQVVVLIDDLQEKGLVERMPDARDRRTNVVVATELGRATRQKARAAVLAAERTLRADLSDHESEVLAGLLRRVAFPTARE